MRPHVENALVFGIDYGCKIHLNSILSGTLEAVKRPLVAIYPGSFDPLTNGHLDLIARGARLVDHLIVAILQNTQKQPLFTVPERMDMIRGAVAKIPNVEVDSFGGLLVDYAEKWNVQAILRGIRAISDYETEMQMALLNRRMRPETETLFLLAGEEHSFISSRMIREIISLGGDVSRFIPASVVARVQAKFPRPEP